MEFMKKEKEERALEREQDKKELKEMISQGVKNEVKAAIEPIIEKQDMFEKEQEVLKSNFSEVLQEMQTIKSQLKARTVASDADYPRLPQPKGLLQGGHEHAGYVRHEGDSGEQGKLRQIISNARRTVGLHSIDSADLVRMRQAQFGGAKTEAEERLFAVQEFLRCELKLSNETIDTMEVETIFPPAKKNPQCLFVTFKYGSSLSKIFERTRCMRKAARIINFIPAAFEVRYLDIREIEFNLRQEEDCQTRVKMGINDLELSKKIRGSGNRWQRVPLPQGLARVDLTKVQAVAQEHEEVTLSPAPGRPCQDRPGKRGRESPGSPAGRSNAKVARDIMSVADDSEKVEVKTWEETIKGANLVTESQITPTKEGEGLAKVADKGVITSISGTPTQQSLPSPIISKYSKIPSLKI